MDEHSRVPLAPPASDTDDPVIPPDSEIDWADRAVIVIHGMGTQGRESTRDTLVRGVENCGATRVGLVPDPPQRTPFGKAPPVQAVRLKRGDREADVYEVYWAPYTSRKTSARKVLGWLLRTTYVPGDALKPPSRKTLVDLIIALGAAIVTIVIVLAGLLSLGNLTAQVACDNDPQSTDPQCTTPVEQRTLTGPRVTAAGLNQIEASFGAIWNSLDLDILREQPLENLTPSHAAEVLKKVKARDWLVLTLIVFVTAQVLFRLQQILRALTRGSFGIDAYKVGAQTGILVLLVIPLYGLVQLVPPVLVAFVWVVTIVGVVIRGASHFLSESLGDVQVYSDRDENSEHFAAREAVLAEADATFGVVARRQYKEVVVIGHSLGSVIAFTAIERLSHREPNVLDRVVALITFGTALEKVKFFFERKKDAKRTPIGPQGPRALAQTVASGRAWINFWYWNDPVANPITTFQPQGTAAVNYSGRSPLSAQQVLDEGRQNLVVNVSLGFPILPVPVWTHSRYWNDRRVMQLITEASLG